MSFTLKTHQVQVKGGRTVIRRVLPYVRLSNGDEQIYVQGGKYYDPGGGEIETLPSWVHGQVEKLSEEARGDIGLTEKKGKSKAA